MGEAAEEQGVQAQAHLVTTIVAVLVGGGVGVIRDQKPLKFIKQKVDPTSSVELFLEALSSRVFFAPTRDRLERRLERVC